MSPVAPASIDMRALSSIASSPAPAAGDEQQRAVGGADDGVDRLLVANVGVVLRVDAGRASPAAGSSP